MEYEYLFDGVDNSHKQTWVEDNELETQTITECIDWVDDEKEIPPEELPTVNEWGAGWDKTCTAWEALLEVEDKEFFYNLAWDIYNMGHGAGVCKGYTSAIVEETILSTELDPDRQKLLDLFLTIEPGEYYWHETFRILWNSLGGMP